MSEKLKDIGEFGLIERIRKKIRVDASVFKGIGDDAAILKPKAGEEILLTTDILIEGHDFRLKEATPYEIGRKALAINLSDIAAMGGVPKHAVIAIGMPAHLPIRFVQELYRGIGDLARQFKVNIVGGDTSASEKIVLSVAVMGYGKAKSAVLRSGAKMGDVIFVTGTLGGSYASKKHLNFVPRISEAQFLVKNFKIHAMMDISDGLASDIHRITKASDVGAVIFKAQIPVSRHAKSIEAALTEGEDFELLFTLSTAEAERLMKMKPKKFLPVGRIVSKAKGVMIVDEKGRVKPLTEKGFDHFR